MTNNIYGILIIFRYNIFSFRIARFIRPFFLLEKSRRLRHIVKNIFKTFLAIADLFAFILFFLLIWAFFGYILFYGTTEGSLYFNTVGQAFISLFILLTTANYPDVMMPSYSVHRAYSLYFIIFLLFALYFCLNALIAVIYNTYREETKNDTLRVCLLLL